MLPSKEELAQRYTAFSDQKLLTILYNNDGYRPEAIEAATEELKKRHIPVDTVQNFVQGEELKNIVATENANVQLPLHQKFLFFFAWFIPFFFGTAFRLNFQEDGFVLKLKQSKRYSIAGLIALFTTTIITIHFELGNLYSFSILFGMFGVFFLIESQFNNKRRD